MRRRVQYAAVRQEALGAGLGHARFASVSGGETGPSHGALPRACRPWDADGRLLLLPRLPPPLLLTGRGLRAARKVAAVEGDSDDQVTNINRTTACWKRSHDVANLSSFALDCRPPRESSGCTVYAIYTGTAILLGVAVGLRRRPDWQEIAR